MERFCGFKEIGDKIKDAFHRKPKNEPVGHPAASFPPPTVESNSRLLTPKEAEEKKRQLVEMAKSATKDVFIIAIAQKGHHVFDVLPEIVQVVPTNVPVTITLQALPGTENDSETNAAIRDLLTLAGPRENVDVRLMRVNPSFRPPILPSDN